MGTWILMLLLACSGGETPTPEPAPADAPEKADKAKGKVKGKAKQPAAPVEMVKATIYFVDSAALAEGREPVLVPVEREVGAKTPERNALWNLFKGPTEEEAARGLVMLKSGSEGFEAFALEGGVAKFKLKGGCSSEGKTLTVFDLAQKTLTGFETVKHVQILGPTDTTAPEGAADHRPDCLQP
jgi:hypothetical protein